MRRPALVVTSLFLAGTIAAGCGSKSTTGGSANGTTATTAGGSATSATPGSGSASPTTTGKTPESSPTGDIPDNAHYNDFTPAAGGFTFKYPEGWSRKDGTVTLFTDKLNSIAVETSKLATAPTVASVTKTELPKVAAATTGYKAGTTRSITRPAGRVIESTYSGVSAPDPVTGKARQQSIERYVYWRAGREVVLTLTSPTGADNVDPWRKVTDSFGWR
ncbi:MAG: hypothetical protein JWN46_460 [Acidimicrobiales bacterium]|nr:hypothetical protein [Acidimicrobiales bacterium]